MSLIDHVLGQYEGFAKHTLYGASPICRSIEFRMGISELDVAFEMTRIRHDKSGQSSYTISSHLKLGVRFI